MTYTEEDLHTDIDWLDAHDVDEPEEFLRYLVRASGGRITRGKRVVVPAVTTNGVDRR